MAKSKFKDVNCSYCKKVTKMMILKEPEDNKGWFQCTKCKHSFCIDLSHIEDDKKDESKETNPDKANFTVYSPYKEFSIGESIFHSEWDDYGKIEHKKKLSNGQSAIMVRFDKSGPKNLIEGLKADEETEIESIEEDTSTEYEENIVRENSNQSDISTDNSEAKLNTN